MALSDREREVLAELEAQLRAEMGTDASSQLDAANQDGEPSEAGQETPDVAADRPEDGGDTAQEGRTDTAGSARNGAGRGAGSSRVAGSTVQVKRLSIQHLLVGALLLVVGLGVIVVGVSMGASALSVLVGVAGFVCALFGALYAVTPVPVSGKQNGATRR